MSSVQAKFAWAIFAGVLASLPLWTVFDGAARAADDCLAEPNGQTPQGKHWYYRIERSTGRHCWYLRGEDEAARAAAPESTTSTKTPSRNADMLAPRSIADARAEWPARPAAAQNGAAVTAPRVVPPAGDLTGNAPPSASAPAATAQTPAASPWPDPSTALPKLGPPPETTAAATDQQADTQAAPTSVPVPPPPAQTAMPTDRNMGSLQKLLLVAFGALALAGLTGSAVYRLAGARRRARMRRDRWPARKVQQIAANAPMPVRKVQQIAADAHQRIAADAQMPQQMPPWAEPEIGRTAPPPELSRPSVESVEIDNVDERVERIEDFLARLTRQLEAEMATPRPERQAVPRPERQAAPHQERQRAAS
jgi:hypothetical protein